MEIRATLMRTVVLIVGMIAAYLIAQVTELPVFSWLTMLVGLFLFLQVYWLIISFIAYLTEQDTERSSAEPEAPRTVIDLDPQSLSQQRYQRQFSSPRQKVSE